MSISRSVRVLLLLLAFGSQGCSPGSLIPGLLQGLAGAAGGPLAGASAGGPLAGPVAAPLPGAPAGTGAPVPPPAPGTGGPLPPAGTGAAADNIAAADQAGLLQKDSFSNDGRLTFTQYGGPTDKTPDGNTQAGVGNRGNLLNPSSLALAPNLIRQYGLKGGEEIYLKSGGRTVYLGHYDDTTGSSSRNNVIDVYDPQDKLGADNFMRTVPAGQWELVIGAQASA